MSMQVSRGSAGEYQADERAGVARLSWRVTGNPYLSQWGYKMADTLEDSLVVSYKTKNTLTIRSSKCWPGLNI